jgi:TetR/AcrR family transcriptional regulator, transcriptional repressor for nem operon
MRSESAVVSEVRPQPETKSQKGAATRDQILNAASRLIHVQGYQSTSLDDVLRESGVGKGNFYYYFKSKEDLGYAIIDRIKHAFVERGLGPAFADGDADPVGQLHAFFDRALDAQRQRNCVGGCAIGNLASELSDVHEGFRQRLAGIFDAYRDHLAEAIRRGQRSGRLRSDADAARVAQFLVAVLEGAILLGKVTRDITVMERCVEELKEHLTLYRTSA